jgi:hypothetical protein
MLLDHENALIYGSPPGSPSWPCEIRRPRCSIQSNSSKREHPTGLHTSMRSPAMLSSKQSSRATPRWQASTKHR